MKIYCDTASLAEIEEWNEHPWVSGFTTNPTLMRASGIGKASDPMWWAKQVVALTDKPVSIDGPPEVWELGENVWLKYPVTQNIVNRQDKWQPMNWTAICYDRQLEWIEPVVRPEDILSIFAGRIMDAGRGPWPLISDAKALGAQVLWASVREPYNIVQAENTGCDIVTVPPAILRKYLDWHGKPLEVVAEETIAQFERDSEGLW